MLQMSDPHERKPHGRGEILTICQDDASGEFAIPMRQLPRPGLASSLIPVVITSMS